MLKEIKIKKATGCGSALLTNEEFDWLIDELDICNAAIEGRDELIEELEQKRRTLHAELNSTKERMWELGHELEDEKALWVAQNEANAEDNQKLREVNRRQFQEILLAQRHLRDHALSIEHRMLDNDCCKAYAKTELLSALKSIRELTK